MKFTAKFFAFLGMCAGLALGATFCGGDSTIFAINAGTLAPEADAQDFIAFSNADCQSGGGACNGNFGGTVYRGGPDNDLAAASDFLVAWLPWLLPTTVRGYAVFQTFLSTNIPDGEFRKATWSLTMTINCNSTDTMGPGLGDASMGSIVTTVYYTGSLNNLTQQEPGTDAETLVIYDFRNCTMTGDILANGGGDESIRFNGILRSLFPEPNMATPEMPAVVERSGNLSVLTDFDGDGIFGVEFWGENMAFDGTQTFNGTTFTYDGGVCIGSSVLLGDDDTITSDDDCAPEADDPFPEGFSQSTSTCGFFIC